MYTGPAYGGVAPLTNLGSTCSIIATENGFDGRMTNGHVDDYWVSFGSAGPDPWVGGTEHTWGNCTADYMGTNQWKWDLDLNGSVEHNTDGATTLWANSNNGKLYDYTPSSAYGLPQTALCHGLRLFAESRGYTVVENYTQRTDNAYTGGFSFVDYMAEIDAGRPLMLQVTGHSMVGVGYDVAGSIVYLHDTWSNEVQQMAWDGTYDSRALVAVTCITIIPEPATMLLFCGTAVAVLLKQKRKV